MKITGDTYDKDGERIARNTYVTWCEVISADRDARKAGGKVSGTLITCLALNRARHQRCIYCGCKLTAEPHTQQCDRRTISRDPYTEHATQPEPHAPLPWK